MTWKYLLNAFIIISSSKDQWVGSCHQERDSMAYFMLPTSLAPIHQLIRLQPIIKGNFSIEGYTEISFSVTSATSNVTLHMVDIVTRNETVQVVDTSNNPLDIINLVYDAERQFFIATLANSLQVGNNYTLSMEFTGYLNDNLVGFYRSSYTDPNGENKIFAVTQFAPTDARRAFPCFDEPLMKSQFTIQLIREGNMSAESNMPKIITEQLPSKPGWYMDTFEQSVSMSTYLIAFLVSDLVGKNSTDSSVWFRVLGRQITLPEANYSLDIGPKILTYYENYFTIPYPLPKVDMAAVPDFYYGAMENWGLIIYRETAMLYHDQISSAKNKESVCAIVAHELAHQWFGNLVTFKWWTDVWLNEGFASFLQYAGCNSVEPNFGLNDMIILEEMQKIFQTDSLETSHPLSNPINHPDDLNHIYDSIAYLKGASVLRMITYFLTEATFQKGLINYLNYFAYSNADQDNLWQFLTDQAHSDGTLDTNLNVKTIMDTWTLQMGFPVLTVERNDLGEAFLTQERYLQVQNENSTDNKTYSWWIPISYVTQTNPDFANYYLSDWMTSQEIQKTLTGMPSTNEWVIFNTQQAGYFRVNYDTNNWNAIGQQFDTDHRVIGLLNRAQLLDDSFNLAKSGLLIYDVPMDLGTYLNHEEEYVPLTAALTQMNYLYNMYRDESGYGHLQNYLQSFLIPIFDSIGFNDNTGDPHQEQLKRSLILPWACKVGYEPCLVNSSSLYNLWMANTDNHTIISPNLKTTVYCYGIAAGDTNEWNFAYSQYTQIHFADEKRRLLEAMGCSKNPQILSSYLDMAFNSTSGIRKQDVSAVISAVSSNAVGEDLAWNYIVTNDDAITAYMGSYQYVATFVNTVSRNFNSQEDLDKLTQFKIDNSVELGTNTQSVDQAIERTRNNIVWMTNYYNVIFSWLDSNGYGQKRWIKVV